MCLSQNYPNPFNPSTKISFSHFGSLQKLKLSIFNQKGELVREIYEGNASRRGNHSYDFNGSEPDKRDLFL
jgi:hypothetical protein